MTKQLLFKNFGHYYNIIYASKDYKKEAEEIKKLISKYKLSEGKDLLEVACGTGRYLECFKKDFSCTGVDINQGVLKVAKENVKGINFVQANMINMSLNKKFDIILCLFASIGYVKTYKNLRKTIFRFAQHLKPKGIVIIEPWFNKKTYRTGSHPTIYREKEVDIVRLRDSKRSGNISLIDMHYLIAEKNKPVKYLIDKHTLGLFDVDKTLKFMKEFGLKTQFLKNGLIKEKGLFIGVKN